MFKIFREMLSDGDTKTLSSKRVISFLAFVIMAVSYFIDQLTDHKVQSQLFDCMMWIVVGGLGITGLEKFSNKGNKDQ